MALKPSKKDKKEKTAKKVKKEGKEKKEGKGSAARPAVRRLHLKTSPRSAKRKALTQPATHPEPAKEEPKKEEPKEAPKGPKTPKTAKVSKQAPEHTVEPKSMDTRGKRNEPSEKSAPKGKKETPSVSPKELKEQKKREKKASAKAEKKQKKREKRERKTKDEGEENSHEQAPPSEGEDRKTEVAESETPGPRTNLLDRFDTQDSEVNQEYLQSLLKEMSDSPVAVDGSEDEESSGTGSGKGAEDEGSSENSAEEASCKEGKDQSENESDDEDEDESSPTGSSSPESEEEEEETAEPESNSKAGSQAAAVPAAPTEALPGSSLALVAVTADGPAVGAANSIVAARATHKREWDTFTRQCQNRKLFPIELADYYEKSKTDMFNLVKVNVERMREKKTTARQGGLAMKKRDIVKTYPERGEELCKKLRASGRFYRDEEFPSDSEEIFYYVRQPRKVNVDTIVGEKATLGATMQVEDSAAMDQLTGQDGVFAAGALPGMKTDAPSGNRALADILVDDPSENPKKKPKKKKTEATEQVEPTTVKDQAEEIAKDVLKISGDARKLSLSLQRLEMSGTLSKDLATFSKECEKMFTEVQKRLRKKHHRSKDNRAFSEFLAASKNKIEWWKKAEVAGKAFTSAANRKKKVAKAKPGKDGKEGAEAKERQMEKSQGGREGV
ncbi:unnamed protein product [Symbiodinium microadriaticum]|nr:unnamed protein product [Symbiodinium microadriaticum]